jgi:hypothetical protein
MMSDIFIRAALPRDARWTYDDPSGVPEQPLSVDVPDTLRGGVERAAARDGLTPGEWLISVVMRGLLSPRSKPTAV